MEFSISICLLEGYILNLKVLIAFYLLRIHISLQDIKGNLAGSCKKV